MLSWSRLADLKLGSSWGGNLGFFGQRGLPAVCQGASIEQEPPHHHYMEFRMSRVEYLFDLQIADRKSRLLRPSQQLFFRRAYWWVRLQWITLKWKLRQNRKTK